MPTGLGFKGGVLGFGVESIFGSAVPVTKFIEINSDGLSVEEERMHSEAIPQIYQDESEVAQSFISVSGDIEFEMRYEGMELLLKQAMGNVVTAEVASFIVTATNKFIDFDIGAGAILATVTEGTYVAGLTQADVGSLCKAIYDALVVADGVGVYTVSFSASTKKFTITKSIGTLSILWKTGAHGSDLLDTHIGTLIGFSDTANDTGSLSYVSDTAVVSVYTQTFTLSDDLPVGLTFEVDRDLNAFTVEGGKINSLSMSIENGGFLKSTISIVGEDMTSGAVTPSTLPTSALVNFSQGVLQYNSVTRNVPSASFTLNNNLKTDRRFIGSRLISEPQRSGKVEVTGTFTIEFESTTEYEDFRAATSRALTLTFTGGLIKTGHNYSLTITFPIIKLTAGMPKISDAGIISIELPFKAYATTNAREFNIVIKNTLASI